MPTMAVNGVELYYEAYGEGAAILGIHGTPSSARLWVDAARELASRGRCIIYDRRGFGRSQRPASFHAINLSDHIDDAVALLDALSATPAVVVGRSTGGQIALELAHHHPGLVRALVLLEPALFTVDPQTDAWARQLRLRVLQSAAESSSSASEAVFREALGDQAWEALPDPVKRIFDEASPAVLAEIRGRGLDLSAEPLHLSIAELGKIPQPTLIVSAADSPEPLRRVADHLAKLLPRAEKVTVTGGHLINPAHSAVLDFIDRMIRS